MELHNFSLRKISNAEYELEKDYQGETIRFFANEKILKEMEEEVFLQARNVAQLPGLAGPVCIMPDAHVGYGAPIGTVFAMKEDGGYISPGAIGYDINCGMRLLMTNLSYEEIEPYIEKIVDALFQSIPAGLGGKGSLKINKNELKQVVEQGVPYLIKTKGIGWEDDIEHIGEKGSIKGVDFSCVSEEAAKRGITQIATLGSGNHYLEIQRVEQIFDPSTASKLGIHSENQIGVMIHCGSRGFGHQICTDYLRIFERHLSEFRIKIKDRQLVCAPIESEYGKKYITAMSAAANFAFVNREAITHKVRSVFEKVLGKQAERLGMKLVYDVAHNIGKWETHGKKVFVHRKGATRSFPGTPVIIGGSMETGSYLLIGTDAALKKSYGSTAHGSGRTMSRQKAKQLVHGEKLWQEMKSKGIYVKAHSFSDLAEEAGFAYKNISDVIQSIESAGLSKPVAYFRPIGNIKG